MMPPSSIFTGYSPIGLSLLLPFDGKHEFCRRDQKSTGGIVFIIDKWMFEEGPCNFAR